MLNMRKKWLMVLAVEINFRYTRIELQVGISRKGYRLFTVSTGFTAWKALQRSSTSYGVFIIYERWVFTSIAMAIILEEGHFHLLIISSLSNEILTSEANKFWRSFHLPNNLHIPMKSQHSKISSSSKIVFILKEPHHPLRIFFL